MILAVLLYLLMDRTTFGFAARIAGGNPRVAEAQGLSVGRLIVTGCFIGRALARASLASSKSQRCMGAPMLHFMRTTGSQGTVLSGSRHSPLAIIPVACLFGGIGAAGGLIQRRMELPDADRCCKGLCSSRCWQAKRSTAGCPFFAQPRTATYERTLERHHPCAHRIVGRHRSCVDPVSVRLSRRVPDGKDGQINLGLEGTLVLGAMTGYAASYLTGSPWLGIGAAALTEYTELFTPSFANCRASTTSPSELRSSSWEPGPLLLRQAVHPTHRTAHAIDCARLVEFQPGSAECPADQPPFSGGNGLAIFLRWAFRNTYWGLIVRTTGDSEPAARDLRGIGQRRAARGDRYRRSVAGIGGAFCAVLSWELEEGLSSGQGLMAVALVIFARWDPVHCFYAAVLFGAAGAIGPALAVFRWA